MSPYGTVSPQVHPIQTLSELHKPLSAAALQLPSMDGHLIPWPLPSTVHEIWELCPFKEDHNQWPCLEYKCWLPTSPDPAPGPGEGK